jgi:hypothetical protein
MTAIPLNIRRAVTQRAGGLCEYCQTAKIVVVTVEIDHIYPVAKGGSTTLENLCLVCRTCNSYKRDFIIGFDPETQTEQPLFNPRTQQWHEHFQWSEDKIILIGLTSIGRATIERLQINNDDLVNARRSMDSGWLASSESNRIIYLKPAHPKLMDFRIRDDRYRIAE